MGNIPTFTEKDFADLGKLWACLLTLEEYLRNYLSWKEKGIPTSPNVYEIQEGNFINKDAYTNHDTLGKLIQKFNNDPANREKIGQEKILKIRDALAHGRLVGKLDDGYWLSKYGIPKNGKVEVEFHHKFNSEWLTQSEEYVRKETGRVRVALNKSGFMREIQLEHFKS